MEFAINYSPQAADLWQSGAIQIERFKCASDWPHLIPLARAHGPVYIHFTLRTDPGEIRALDVDAVNALCAETDTPTVNLHLMQGHDDFTGMDNMTTDPADRAAIYDYVLSAVQLAVERFGRERVIVENIPFYGEQGRAKRPVVEPDLIRQIVEQTGVGFLLDISHARMSAYNLRMDAYAYLEQLPGEVMRELHVTGIGLSREGRLCDHLGLTDADWPFYEWVLDRIMSGVWAAPWMVAFEYGGLGPKFEWRSATPVIAEQVPRLYALAHAANGRARAAV